MPKTRVIFYQDQDGEAPVLEWLKILLKQDRKGYANCVARIQQLASAGYELRRPAADYLRDGVYEFTRCATLFSSFSTRRLNRQSAMD